MTDTANLEQESALSFEASYERLEAILKELNQGEIALEKSLKLYEEANHLILTCHQKLTGAEQKVEQLVKQRNGKLTLSADGKPLRRDLDPKREEILKRDLQAPYDQTP